MRQMIGWLVLAALGVAQVGCSDDVRTIRATPRPTATMEGETPVPTVTASVPPTEAPTEASTEPPTAVPTATSVPTETPVPDTPAPTSTPTETPTVDPNGPRITFLGLAAADDQIIRPTATDRDGRPIFTRLFGHSFSLVIEGQESVTAPLGGSAYSPEGALPDLQIILDRDIGDGDPEVCDVDIDAGEFGGVPATDPFAFSEDQTVVDAINDLGCRVNDGTGEPVGRSILFPCTRDDFGNFAFADQGTSLQFCLPIAKAWEFQPGDTTVAVRLRGADGRLSPVSEMIVRVDGDARADCEIGGPGGRAFSAEIGDSDLISSANGGSGVSRGNGLSEPGFLCAGPSDDEVYPLRLLEDFVVGFEITTGEVFCASFSAQGSSGFLDCEGSQVVDVLEQLDAADGSRQVIPELGVPSGSGAAQLALDAAFFVLSAGNDPADCTRFPGSPMPVVLTTGTATAEILNANDGTEPLTISALGENFDCAGWRSEDGPGRLVLPLGALATSVGDVANVLILDD